jgi:hypothetical protein
MEEVFNGQQQSANGGCGASDIGLWFGLFACLFVSRHSVT